MSTQEQANKILEECDHDKEEAMRVVVRLETICLLVRKVFGRRTGKLRHPLIHPLANN